MAQIEINCIGQTAIYTNTPEIFSGDVNIDTVKFTFDEAWNGYDMKTAVFYNNPKDTYPVMLDENNVAVIPEAVMADKCKLSIGVFGTNANGDVKTSKILTYNIGKGAISNDLEATTPPEFWEQLLTRQINFENNMDNKFDTLSSEFDTLSDDVDTIEAIALGRNQSLSYTSYSEMITALNSMDSDEFNIGQNIYIGAVGVPDLWVYGVEEANVEYTYVDDDTFVESLNKDVTVQVGYFKLAQLETQKVDVGGINRSIDALEEGLTTLESGLASERLLWNISDNIYCESELLDITFPTSVGNVLGMLEVNNKLYVMSALNGTGTYMNIYDGENWTKKLVTSTAVNGINMVELNGDIYYTYIDQAGTVYLYKYDETQGKGVNICSKSPSGNITYTSCLTKDNDNNKLYFIWVGSYSTSTYSIMYTTYDGISLGDEVTLSGKSSDNTMYNAYIIDDILYLSMKRGGSNVLTKYDINTRSALGSNSTGRLYSVYNKDEKLYVSSSTLYKVNNGEYLTTLNVLVRAICDYGNDTIMATTAGVFSKFKLYKKATSYATKGAKIYTPNSFAISDNLEPIDNGYRVTADGEVKIGIYD